VLDAFATRLTDGFGAAAPLLADALGRLLALDAADPDLRRWLFLADGRVSAGVALELWDAEAFHSLAARQERFSRDTGGLVHRQFALSFLARSHLFYGELTAASGLIAEDRLLAEVTGARRLGNVEMTLAAFRGKEGRASKLIDATAQDAAARGWTINLYSQSVLYNGLGRHDEACEAARQAFAPDQLGHGTFVVPELVEAASKTADTALLAIAQAWMAERAQATDSEWALGIHARVRALLSKGAQADAFHRESLARLGRTRLRVELARGHLLYGEWLRRERRRVDAREHLGVAHEMLSAMGLEAFADRARRELLATGATVRRRTVQARDELTAQERQIARLARDGLTNPEIAMRLFISPRTVQYHLRKVFSKLGIASRVQLDDALSEDS
jgi:DNA-binding CsgD family transcriptional regulator